MEEKAPFRREWNGVLCKFLESAGLFRACDGFKEDMMVISDDWEKDHIWSAIHDLVKDMTVGGEPRDSSLNGLTEISRIRCSWRMTVQNDR